MGDIARRYAHRPAHRAPRAHRPAPTAAHRRLEDANVDTAILPAITAHIPAPAIRAATPTPPL